jgi:Arc/MetJ family transcription regulator
LQGAGAASMWIESSVGTHKLAMRTNIEIDDDLIREALRVSGLRTKRAAVEAGLKALIRLNRQKKILDLAGKVHWEGNLDESRESRFPP